MDENPISDTDGQDQSDESEWEDEDKLQRPIRKRSRSSYFEEEDPSSETRNVEDDFPRNDSSFSTELFSPRHSSHSRIVVPSNISINANFFVLKNSSITPADATKLYEQCLIPGFVNSISSNHILILRRAQYQITNRVKARRLDWGTLFPTLRYEQCINWMDNLTVLQAATLVYTLFGPESTAQQSIDQKTVDVLLRETPFDLDFSNESIEDITFGEINEILESERLSNGQLSSDRLCELSKIISNRLPVDSQIVTAYREAFALLSDHERQCDTPLN
jgi:hypothetical protein